MWKLMYEVLNVDCFTGSKKSQTALSRTRMIIEIFVNIKLRSPFEQSAIKTKYSCIQIPAARLAKRREHQDRYPIKIDQVSILRRRFHKVAPDISSQTSWAISLFCD